MICPKCGQETPIQKSFCVACGGFLEVGFGEVRDVVETEVRQEAQAALTRRAGVWLAVALALLVAAVAFRTSHWESDLPRFDEPPVLQVLELEPAKPFPMPEMPVLSLAVPPPAPAPGAP